ncbi:glycosyltransferase family 4 protein [Cellulomonas sp. NPDC055163]
MIAAHVRVKPRVLLVASPLHARSGVYRSSRELVAEARRRGLRWSLLLGVAGSAAGSRPDDDPPWVVEDTDVAGGLRGLRSLRGRIEGFAGQTGADVVVSLLPQTDMALSTTRLPWVAYLRGLPWPERGESSTVRALAWERLERAALTRARATWATTPVLADGVSLRRPTVIVPAGIAPVPRSWDGRGGRRRVVWAARYDHDKSPGTFLQVMDGTGLDGRMFGSGPLRASIEAAAPVNVTVGGWVPPDGLWDGALAYVGTSAREAFGRSAVEAAMSGVPVVLSEAFGCAELLYRDADLRRRLVLPRGDARSYRRALEDLAADEGLRRAVSDHLSESAERLTIAGSVSAVEVELGRLQHGEGSRA